MQSCPHRRWRLEAQTTRDCLSTTSKSRAARTRSRSSSAATTASRRCSRATTWPSPRTWPSSTLSDPAGAGRLDVLTFRDPNPAPAHVTAKAPPQPETPPGYFLASALIPPPTAAAGDDGPGRDGRGVVRFVAVDAMGEARSQLPRARGPAARVAPARSLQRSSLQFGDVCVRAGLAAGGPRDRGARARVRPARNASAAARTSPPPGEPRPLSSPASRAKPISCT